MRGIIFIVLAGAFVALFIYPGYLFKLQPEEPLPPVAKVEPAPPPEPPKEEPKPAPRPQLTFYPVELALESANGVAMESMVLGRGPTKLHVERKSDKKQFALEIAKLSPKSQSDVGNLTESATDEAIVEAVATSTPPPPPVMSFLEKEIEKRQSRIVEKQIELENPKLTSSQKNLLQKDIKTLEAEIMKFGADLRQKEADRQP